MPPEEGKQLTDRQQAVMERIDKRMSIKVIALELGVSETRINQHIRALKDIFKTESLADLVEAYRATLDPEDTDEGVSGSGNKDLSSAARGLTESVYSKNQVQDYASVGINGPRVDQGELVMSDVLPLLEQAPWLRQGEPKVVPGVLDGEHAVLFRLGAILAIAFGFLAAVVLTVTAAMAISEALDGRAAVPVDEEGFS